jgi:hypothetical protein
MQHRRRSTLQEEAKGTSRNQTKNVDRQARTRSTIIKRLMLESAFAICRIACSHANERNTKGVVRTLTKRFTRNCSKSRQMRSVRLLQAGAKNSHRREAMHAELAATNSRSKASRRETTVAHHADVRIHAEPAASKQRERCSVEPMRKMRIAARGGSFQPKPIASAKEG